MDLMDYRRKIIANSPHLSSASGAVATFSDGADLPLKYLIVDIEPVQSGTGDPSPTNIRPISGWNAVNVTRSGESALKPSTAFTETQNGLTFTSDGKGTYSVKGTNTATTTVRSAILPVQSFTIPPSSSHTLYINNNAVNSSVFLSFMNGSTSIDSWAFNVLNREASSYGTMGNKLCDGLRIVVAAGQTVDITFSPMLLSKENTVVYSIGGKNLFSTFEDGDSTSSRITFDFSDSDVVKISGTSTVNNASSQKKIIGGTDAPTPIEFIQGQTYTISLQGTVSVSKANDFRIILLSDSNTILWYGDSTNGVWTFTPESTFVAERIMFRVKSNGTTVNVDAHLQIELGSTATSYEPYQTFYGGTLNPLTGVLTAYPYYASYNGETLTGRWVSDRDKYVAGTTPTIGAQVVDMSGTGTKIQLTPQQVRSLYGNNTIFADTGNVALEYWAHA